MSASVATDRANVQRRGTLLAYIFSNQGWGSFVGSLAFIIVLLCYRHTMEVDGKTSKVDGGTYCLQAPDSLNRGGLTALLAVWRILVGMSLIPAFGTLYQRLTLPESTRYQEARKAAARVEDEEAIDELKKKANADPAISEQPVKSESSSETTENKLTAEHHAAAKSGHFREFFQYFSEWRHLKVLIGTCTCWFLLDIAFYGINLNQNVVLQQIGFDGKTGSAWHKLFKIGVGNLIITALGFVPGYYASILTIEKLGRKWIQIQGFLLAALFRRHPFASSALMAG